MARPTRATRIIAVIYDKEDEHQVVIFVLSYRSQDDAEAEYKAMREEGSLDGLIGHHRHDKKTLVLMSIPPECPDKEFFLIYLRSVSDAME